MDAIFFVRVCQVHDLTEPMITSLFSGMEGDAVRGGPKQIKALQDRNLVSSTYGTLTELGKLVVRALKNENLTDDERSEILTVEHTPKSSGSPEFVVHPQAIKLFEEIVNLKATDIICMAGEDVPSEDRFSWGEAKAESVTRVLEARNSLRELLKDVRSVTKRTVREDVSEDAEETHSEEIDSDDTSDTLDTATLV